MKGEMKKPIQALTPEGLGHQFAFYGDSCSGVPGGPHEETHRSVNQIVARLCPEPEFIVFPGDEVIGLTNDMDGLRAQWRYWLDREMAWLDRSRVPLFNSTGNHTTYSAESEAVFAQMLPHLPLNGPADQQRLSYFVRQNDLLLIFVHTLWSRFGGEGHVETDWLQETLETNADARWKFVVGHHPAFPVNGYTGACARTIGEEHVGKFWGLLRSNGVMAYLCSHILAFDVQVHDGVLQITSAGAGTAHRMPEDTEYLHAVQIAVDGNGLRGQVLDTKGDMRERFSWPRKRPGFWTDISGETPAEIEVPEGAEQEARFFHLRIVGMFDEPTEGQRETLLSARCARSGHEVLWIGVSGQSRRLTVTLQPRAGRSPHYWFGPETADVFDFELALDYTMGPGGIMFRKQDGPWSSMESSSPWGPERLVWPLCLSVGESSMGHPCFSGENLKILKAVCQT